MTETLTGVVIKKLKHNADDEIITILCSDEIVTFIALGTRKLKSKNRVALDYGNIINAEIFRARLKNRMSKLKKAVLVKQPPIMVSDTAEVVIDIVKLLQKLKVPSERLFNAIIASYGFFGVDYNHNIKTYIAFSMLDALGVRPDMSKCSECHRSDRITDFDYKDGGFRCAWHQRNERPLNQLKGIKALGEGIRLYKDIDPATNKVLFKELKDILGQYIYIDI